MRDLIDHGAAQAALRSVVSPTDAALLETYVVQCANTSRDLKAAVVAVLELFGPDGLREVESRVVAARQGLTAQDTASAGTRRTN